MLAVQQAIPSMGASQPPSDDDFMLFGYNLDPTQDLLPEPPEPPPGAPLLTETDNKFLSSFFQDITADQYNMPSFGEGLNFSDAWLDLPPQFMGTATSFGQQPAPTLASPPSHGIPSSQAHGSRLLPPASSMMPPPPPLTPSQPAPQHRHSDDVLHAAATLLQNGSSSRSNSTGDLPQPRRTRGLPVGHLRHQPLEEFKEDGRKSAGPSVHDNTFTEWMWGSQQRRVPRSAGAPADIQWGSDSHFDAQQGYTSEASKESAESMQQEQLKLLDLFEVDQSVSGSRPGSPISGHNGSYATHHPKPADLVKSPDDVDAPPRKRRKSKNVKEAQYYDDDEDDESASSKTARRRRPKGDNGAPTSSPPGSAGGSGKRRKSMGNAARQPRENLTEVQKRENHIRSEQKRRTLIKEGFDDLCELVPGLRGGGFSKSTMLSMAAEWLEDIMQGNTALSAQLANLERR